MRVLLDENLPAELALELAGHEVHTVTGLGWAGVTNSDLLARTRGQFDVLLTMDGNLEFQQNLAVLPFGIVIIRTFESSGPPEAVGSGNSGCSQ